MDVRESLEADFGEDRREVFAIAGQQLANLRGVPKDARLLRLTQHFTKV